MKIKDYNQLMQYLTRPAQSTNKPKEEKPYYMTNLATGGLDNVNAPAPKRDILDYVNQVQHTYDDVPLSEKNKKINDDLMNFAIERSNTKVAGYPKKNNVITTYSNGGAIKKKTPLATEKNNIVIAMSETPSEEFQLDLSTEIEQFQKWLEKNKDGTYKEFLKDKTAMLTDEQKKDPKIIDLEPYLPNFEDVIKEYEKEQEEKKESLEDFIKRRSNEMMLAESNGGVRAILRKKIL